MTIAEVPELQSLELAAELAALQALATKHRREYTRLRTIELARMRGETPRFTRDRMTREQLAALPPVVDSAGVELAPGQTVKCPDGVMGKVLRVDKRSKRAVIDRRDGTRKMTVAARLHVTVKPKRSGGGASSEVAA